MSKYNYHFTNTFKFFGVKILYFIVLLFYLNSSVVHMSASEIPYSEVVNTTLGSGFSEEVDLVEGHFTRHKKTYAIVGGVVFLVSLCAFFYFLNGRGGSPDISIGSTSTKETTDFKAVHWGSDSSEASSQAGGGDSFSIGHYPDATTFGNTMHQMEPCIDAIVQTAAPSRVGAEEEIINACTSVIDSFAEMGVVSIAEASEMTLPFSALAYAALTKPLVLKAIEDFQGARFIVSSCYLDCISWKMSAQLYPEVSLIWKNILADCLLNPDAVSFNGFTKPVWILYSLLKDRCLSLTGHGLSVDTSLADKQSYIFGEILGNPLVQKAVEKFC